MSNTQYMAESVNNNKKTKKESKKSLPVVWDEEYLNYNSGDYMRVHKDIIVGYGKKFLEYVRDNPEIENIVQARLPFGFDAVTAQYWKDKYPDFKKFYDHAVAIIGARRDTGALNFKKNAAIVIKGMPFYDKEQYAEVKEADKQNQNTGNTIVIAGLNPTTT